MVRTIFTGVFVTISILAGCATADSAPKREVLTPVQLISRAAELSGQRVAVAGYFRWDTDTRSLWENEAAYLDAKDQRRGSRYDYWSKCITVHQQDASLRGQHAKATRLSGTVTILGEGVLWKCNRVAITDAKVAHR